MIVFEELTDIRERLLHADWHHIRAFGHLVEYVEYKAPERGVAAEQVEPDHTSQWCSHTDCGFTHEDNRDGERFPMSEVWVRNHRKLQCREKHRTTICVEATTQTAFLAHVEGRRRTSRCACEWWDMDIEWRRLSVNR